MMESATDVIESLEDEFLLDLDELLASPMLRFWESIFQISEEVQEATKGCESTQNKMFDLNGECISTSNSLQNELLELQRQLNPQTTYCCSQSQIHGNLNNPEEVNLWKSSRKLTDKFRNFRLLRY